MSEHNFGINITARNEANAQIIALEERLKALRNTMREVVTNGLQSADVTKVIQQLNAAIQQTTGNLTRLRTQFNIASSADLANIKNVTREYERQNIIRERSLALQQKQVAESAAALAQQIQIRNSVSRGREGLEGVAIGTESLARQRESARIAQEAASMQSRWAAETYASIKAGEFAQKESIASIQAAARAHDLAAGAARRNSGAIRGVAGASGVMTRELRHGVAIFDELARGQRGALFSTLGASFRDAGFGAKVLIPGIAALGVVMGGMAIVRGAERMGDLARNIRAGAASTGMAMKDYASLSGAIQLVGYKAGDADVALRHLADQSSKALAEPSSRAANAFKAIGISLDQLKATGGDTSKVFDLLVNAVSMSENSFNRSAVMTELLGRNMEHLVGQMEKGQSAFDAMRARAAELGIVLSEKDVKALEQTGEKVHDLSVTIEGQAIKSFVAWKPVIDAVIDSLGALATAASAAMSGIARAVKAGQEARNKLAEEGVYVDTEGGAAFIPPPAAKVAKTNEAAIPPRSGAGRGGLALNFEQPTPRSVKPLGGEETAMEAARERIEDAGLKASEHAGANARKNRQEVAQAEIAAIKKELSNVDLTDREKARLRNESTQKQIALNESIAAGSAKSAEQDYKAFAAQEQNKIREARGRFGEQQSILEEWKARAIATYGETSARAIQALEQIKRVSDLVVRESISDQIHLARTKYSEKESELREFEADMRAQQSLPRGDARRISTQDSLGFQIQKAYQLKEETLGALSKIRETAVNAGATTGQISTIDAEMARIGVRWDAQIHEMVAKANEAGDKVTKAFADPLKKAFDGLGSAFEGVFSGILEGKSLREVEQGFVKGIATTGVNFIGGTASRLAATQVPGATPGQDLGSAASQYLVSKLLDKGTDALTKGGTDLAGSSIVATTVTATSQEIVGAIVSVGASIDTLLGELVLTTTATAVKPEFLGTSYSMGGIVPSAAGGWALPSFAGGQPAILHSGEMVLPGDISKGLQDMIQGGGGGGSDTHIHVSAMDGPSFHKWLQDGGGDRMITDAVRRGGMNNMITMRNFGRRFP